MGTGSQETEKQRRKKKLTEERVSEGGLEALKGHPGHWLRAWGLGLAAFGSRVKITA